MTRSFKHTSCALPYLSARDEDSKSLVLQDMSEQTTGVFAPSALRNQTAPMTVSTNRAFAVALFGLFVIVLLLTFFAGINAYQALNAMAEDEATQRLEQSFLVNTVHSNDMYDAVEAGEGPEGKALVLRETVDGASSYETRIYAFDGSIVQEYALAEAPYAPEKAIVLFDSERFDFSYEHALLTIWTDGGSVNIALRSEEGAS